MSGRRVWVALACTDPENNGPEESFREVVDGRVYSAREDAMAAAKRTGLPFFEGEVDELKLAQWCTVDSYTLVPATKRRKRGGST